MKEQRGCEIRITSQLDMFATLPLTQLCLSGLQMVSMHKGKNVLVFFLFFFSPQLVSSALEVYSVGRSQLDLKRLHHCLYINQWSHVWFGSGILIYTQCWLGTASSHLLCIYIFKCLPCWAGLPSSDSPSICLFRLMNDRKSICFLRRWWPTAAKEVEGK